jgi:hypothetical protein
MRRRDFPAGGGSVVPSGSLPFGPLVSRIARAAGVSANKDPAMLLDAADGKVFTRADNGYRRLLSF